MSVTRRHRMVVVLAAAAALVVSGCGSSAEDSGQPPPQAGKPTGDITFWHFFTDREERGDPGGGQGLRGGQPRRQRHRQGRPGRREDAPGHRRRQGSRRRPVLLDRHRRQVLLHRRLASTSTRTSTRDKVDLERSSRDRALATREFEGKRCAMPLLADAYGLYYNKALLAGGRLRRAAEDAERARRRWRRSSRPRRPTARSSVAGFLPAVRLLRELAARTSRPASARPGSPTTASPPSAPTRRGRSMLEWQKALVDWSAYKKLQRVQRQPGRGVLGRQRVPEGQGRDDDRRRVPHRVHPRTSRPTSTSAPRRSRSPTPRPTATARATSPATSSASRRARRTPRRPGR